MKALVVGTGRPDMRRGLRSGLVGIAAIVAAASVTACGSSEPARSVETTKGAQPAGVREATAKVDELRKAPTALTVPALPKAPAPGKSVYRISCKLPECATSDAVVAKAIGRLGWKLHTIKPDLTPEAFAGAWTQAVSAKPDVIAAYDVVPLAVIKDQLEQAQRAGVKVVMSAGPSRVGQYGIDASIGSVPFYEADAVGLMDWAIADSGGTAHVAWVYGPSVPLQNVVLRRAQQEARRLCPNCRIDPIAAQPAEVGKAIPGKVVSHIQQHPDVKYVLASGSGILLGVSRAVKAAGLSAKVGTSHSQVTDLENVTKGIDAVAIPTEALGWRIVDAAARLVEGAPLPRALADPVGERQLFDKANIAGADATKPWAVPDVESTFVHAWHVDATTTG